MITAGLAVKSILDGTPSIVALRDDRIYPTMNSQEANTYPMQTYHEPTIDILHHIDGTQGVEESRVNLITYGTSYGALKELTKLCKDVLNGFKYGTVTIENETLTIQSMEVATEQDLPVEDLVEAGGYTRIHSTSLIIEVMYKT